MESGGLLRRLLVFGFTHGESNQTRDGFSSGRSAFRTINAKSSNDLDRQFTSPRTLNLNAVHLATVRNGVEGPPGIPSQA